MPVEHLEDLLSSIQQRRQAVMLQDCQRDAYYVLVVLETRDELVQIKQFCEVSYIHVIITIPRWCWPMKWLLQFILNLIN